MKKLFLGLLATLGITGAFVFAPALAQTTTQKSTTTTVDTTPDTTVVDTTPDTTVTDTTSNTTTTTVNGTTFTRPSGTVDNTPDNDTVAIIKGGVTSESDLKSKYSTNTYGDVDKVYDEFGISEGEMTGMVNGIVWRDGRVTVNDRVVATGATTAGRWNNPKSGMTAISGTKKAYTMSTSNFTDAGQTAMVKMTNGKFDFAVIKSCGNPVKAKAVSQPTQPAPPTGGNGAILCRSITVTPRSGSTTQFDVRAVAAGTLDDTHFFTYVVKDETGTIIKRFNDSDGTTTVTQTEPGTYTIEGQVVRNDQTFTAAQCTRQFTVTRVVTPAPTPAPTPTPTPTPVPTPAPQTPSTTNAECTMLRAQPINDSSTYIISAIHSEDSGVVLTTTDFTFGDGQVMNDVAEANLENVTHTFPVTGGPFTVTARLHFRLPDGTTKISVCTTTVQAAQVQSATVVSAVTPTPPPPAPAPAPAQAIPSTGPAEVASVGLGISTVLASGVYYLRSRRDLFSSFFNQQ